MRLHADHEVVADDRYMLLQTLVGVWPVDGAADDLAERVKAWQQKALREGKLRSSWEAPDEAYEEEAAGLVDDLLADAAFVQELADYVAALAPAARANTIVQTLLRYTV
ncbi:hypothetical protein LXJ58_30065, partial [Escherichia coli]|nr:hypothetical protein [Escherichia coli]